MFLEKKWKYYIEENTISSMPHPIFPTINSLC